LIEANKQGYKHIIIFQHIPWFITAPNDADQYFTIPLTRRIPMLQLFRKYNVIFLILFDENVKRK